MVACGGLRDRWQSLFEDWHSAVVFLCLCYATVPCRVSSSTVVTAVATPVAADSIYGQTKVEG